MTSPRSQLNFLYVVAVCFIVSDFQASVLVHSRFSPSHDALPYCNIPQSMTGMEGQNVEGYTLKHVDLVLTPGQTNIPLKVTVEGQAFKILTSCDLKSNTSFSEKVETFAEVSDIYRVVQEDRHGFKAFHPTFNTDCTTNQVTSLGLHQLISLGEHLHRAYFPQGLYSKLVPKATHIHVESVPHISTYQSLLSFLHGLLPEKEFTKVRVHKSLDNFCSLSDFEAKTCLCHYVEDLSPYILRALEKGQFMFKSDIYQSKLIDSFMGNCFDGKVGGIELFESLMLYKCNNMSSLCLDSTSCLRPTEQQLQQLYDISLTYIQHLNDDHTFKTFSELETYPFLSRLFYRSFSNADDRFNVYMGTRPFLQFLVTSLNVPLQEVIPLASRFAFEVFQKNRGQTKIGDLYIRALLNGKDVTEHLIGCDSLENGLCPMTSFKAKILLMGKMYSNQC